MRLPRWVPNVAGALTLCSLGLWVFHRHITAEAHSADHAFTFHDLFALYYPLFEFSGSAIREGRLPLWNPYQLAGVPFLAALDPGVYYPPNALYILLPIHHAMAVLTLGHLLLAGCLATLYARTALGTSRVAALAAGTVYMVSTYTLWMTFALTQLHAIAWLPLLFLGVDRAIRTPGPRWALAIAAGLALPILGGNLQILSYEAYALIPYAIACFADTHRERLFRKRAGGALTTLALGVALGLLLAAPQIVPTAELARLSSRPPGGLTAEKIQPLGTVPWMGIRTLLDGQREPLSYLFPGVVVFLLVPFAPLRRETRGRVAALALVGTLAAWLSFGPDHPVGRFYLRMPLGNWFRDLERAWPVALFSIAALASNGLETVRRGELRGGTRRVLGALGAAVVAGGITFLAPADLHWIVISAGAGFLALAAARIPDPGRTAVALLVVAFLALELDRSIPVNRAIVPYVGQAFRQLYAARDLLVWTHDLDPTRRLFTQERFLEFPTAPKIGSLFRVPLFSDFGALVPRTYEAWTRRMTAGMMNTGANVYMGTVEPPFFLRSDPRFLDYAAVSHVILFNEDPRRVVPPVVVGMQPIRWALLPGAGELGTRDPGIGTLLLPLVYRNEDAWPRAFLAREVRRVKNGEEALGLLERLPRGTGPLALVEAPSSIRLPAAAPEGSDATIVDSEPERVEVRTASPREALLVLSDTYFPGWSARVDGRPSSILPANHLFRAVVVPAGVHTVVFTYRPLSVRLGLGLGALGLAGAAATLVAGWRGRRSGSAPAGRT